jgi:anaerobic selenocysteine-containing dehydrogenase
MCGLVIETRDQRIEKIRGDENDPLSRGHICPKAVALQDLHHDTDWLRGPLRRRGSDFEEISWEAAIEEAASRLHETQQAHGKSAVATGNSSLAPWVLTATSPRPPWINCRRCSRGCSCMATSF